MTVEMFEETMQAMTARRPFSPFTIELNGGKHVEIDHPGVLLWAEGKSIFRAPGGTLVFFDHESVNRIIDAPAHSAP